jgi:non-ribosomal peptide synthase protein (TIGR01720 family)
VQVVPRAYRTQLPEVLVTAVVQALHAWTGDATWAIDFEGHGREELPVPLDVSRTVGWFTSLYPVRLTLPAAAGPGAALKAIKEQLRRVPQRGLGYGLLRYLHADAAVRERLRAGAPAEVSFNYLGQWDAVFTETPLWRVPALSTGAMQSPRQPRSHLLDIGGLIFDGRLQLHWTYSCDHHHPETIQHLADEFLAQLRTLIDHCVAPEAGGLTPSDFPEFQWSQSDLDSITDAIKSVG